MYQTDDKRICSSHDPFGVLSIFIAGILVVDTVRACLIAGISEIDKNNTSDTSYISCVAVVV